MDNVSAPVTPPLPPSVPPAYPPLVVCPPSWPPPAAPPSFSVWAASVPSWFWLLFAVIVLFACAGVGAMVYVLRELRIMKQRGMRLGSETNNALEDLARRARSGRL